MLFRKNNQYRLKIGNRVIGMTFRPAKFAPLFRDFFGAKGSEEPADANLEFRIINYKGEKRLEDSLFRSKIMTKSGFQLSGGLIEGYYDADKKSGKLRIDKLFTMLPCLRVFEQILYQAFYSAGDDRKLDTFLIHSSAVIHRGMGFIFTGPPDAGKSTIAKVSLPKAVLNDEINIISHTDGKIWVRSTPFNGLFEQKTNTQSELRAILLLHKAGKNELVRIEGAQAVTPLAREIVPPIGLNEVLTPGVKEAMLDMACRLARSIPIFKLLFLPNGSFWRAIDSEFFTKEDRFENSR